MVSTHQPTGCVGLSLKAQHYNCILDNRPALTFFEVHAENFMMDEGPHHRFLSAICEFYQLSIHGVGLSLGSAEGLDQRHLERLKALNERYRPLLMSEHLAWSVADGHFLNDLLPLPMTDEAMDTVSSNVDRVQQYLGRQILVENPSSYLSFKSSHIQEVDFLSQLSERTGCGLLLDVNNVYVSGKNMGFEPQDYLDAFPMEKVGEFHLAGHLLKDINGHELRIDDHGAAICDPVWALYTGLIRASHSIPTLIEWDNNIPEFPILMAEAEKAVQILETARRTETSYAGA